MLRKSKQKEKKLRGSADKLVRGVDDSLVKWTVRRGQRGKGR